MVDLISRQAAIDALDKRFDSIPMEQTTEILQLRRDLRQLPPAQLEIIRCKDCNHWDGVDTCDVIDAPVWDNDFCSMAERRSDEE